MRRVKRLITEARRISENDGIVSAEAGISDDEVVRFLNDAQNYLFGRLEKINRKAFTKEYNIDVVANQEAYNFPPRTYLDHNLVGIDWKESGNSTYFRRLKEIGLAERNRYTDSAYPHSYILRNKKILLSPIPSVARTNGLRVNYVERLPSLDKRRAKVGSVTVSSGEVTALTLATNDYTDYFEDASAFSSSSILVDDYFSIVGADGTIKARNIPITTISSGGVCTITSYTPESTSETAAVGDYLVSGADATNICPLPSHCEQYLIVYAAWKLMKRDSSADAQEQTVELQAILQELEESWKDFSNDIKYPPVINRRFLWP